PERHRRWRFAAGHPAQGAQRDPRGDHQWRGRDGLLRPVPGCARRTGDGPDGPPRRTLTGLARVIARARPATPQGCSDSTLTDFGSSVTRKRPLATVAASGLGDTVVGASKVLMLSMRGPVNVSPLTARTAMPSMATSICAGRAGSTLVSESHSRPSPSRAATASTRGSVIAPWLQVPASMRTGTSFASWNGTYMRNTW